MIVDFVKIKKKLSQWADIFLREEIKRRTRFASRLGSHIIHEGDRASYETVDKEKKKLEYKKAESSFSLTREEMDKITFKEIVEKLKVVAEDMARQIEGGLFQTLSKGIEEAGNVIPGNPPLSPDSILRGLEMIKVDFDDSRDKPILPVLVMHPNLAKKAMEQEAQMTEEEKREFEKKQKQILDKKYEEYLVRESKRKLVD